MAYDSKVFLEHIKKELLDDTVQSSSMWLKNMGQQSRNRLVFQAIKLMWRFNLDEGTIKQILQIKFFLTKEEVDELLEKGRMAENV